MDEKSWNHVDAAYCKLRIVFAGICIKAAVDVALYLYLIPLQIKKICKCIAWEHFNYYISPNKLVKYARKLAAEHADCVVVLGKNDLNNYLTQYKHCKNVTYIYNPICHNTIALYRHHCQT